MSSVSESLTQAKAHHRAGRLSEAEQGYRLVLQADPAHVEAHYLLGAACHSLGNVAEAIAHFSRAVTLQPDLAAAQHHLALVLAQSGQWHAAAASGRTAIALTPESAEILADLAAILAHLEQWDEAEANCRRAVALKPELAAAHQTLGMIVERRGDLADAADCYRGAIAIAPNFADAHNHLGIVLELQGDLAGSEACYRRAAQLEPRFAAALKNLGTVLARQDRLDEAAANCRRAIELAPSFAAAHHSLGLILERQDQPLAAEASYRRAQELEPGLIDAAFTLGSMLVQQGRVDEARACYQTAQQVRPELSVWQVLIASLCPSVFASAAEIVNFRRQLQREIDQLAASDLQLDLDLLLKSECRPSFQLQFHGQNERPLRETYARLFERCARNERPLLARSGRPRVAFLVSDRHEGIFLRSLGGVLERLNRELFDLTVLAAPRGAALLRKGLRNEAIAVKTLPGEFLQAVEAVREARFDLIYHWEIGTDSLNYCFPFFRVAPVQCTSWGIQITSGIESVDYYLSSELVEPADATGHYRETLVLAKTLLTYQFRSSLEGPPRSRAHFGFDAGQHLYLCAQQLGKFHPDFDPLLAGVLRRDPRGMIAITGDRHGGHVARLLRERFAAHMPDVVDRICFLPILPRADYLSLIAAADVLLDPLHFGGVNSSYDGFSLNKPIVTLPGRYQRGRYTLGCYRKMGLLDCVADDAEAYIAKAVALATDAELRHAVGEKIAAASHVLFEDVESVREHERIFGEMIAKSREA